jgi:uncharacterized membrane protein YdbT with pleckstrin-like domain
MGIEQDLFQARERLRWEQHRRILEDQERHLARERAHQAKVRREAADAREADAKRQRAKRKAQELAEAKKAAAKANGSSSDKTMPDSRNDRYSMLNIGGFCFFSLFAAAYSYGLLPRWFPEISKDTLTIASLIVGTACGVFWKYIVGIGLSLVVISFLVAYFLR